MKDPMSSLLSRLHNKLTTLVPLERRSKNFSFIVVLIGAGLDNFNVTGTLSVYSSIQEHFHSDSPTTTWALSGYALTLGAFIMLGGKMTDILGADKVFISGLFLSSLMCLICAAIEKSIIVLIVFRALQGMFAAVTIPSMFPIAYSYYAAHGFGSALLSIVLMLTSSTGVGLTVGGAFALTDIGYKGFFYTSFAIAFTLSVVLYLTMYPVETEAQNRGLSMRNLDLPGTFMVVVGILLIILGLTEGGESWTKPAAYVPLPLGVLVLLVGGWFELVYIQNFKDKVNRAKAEQLPVSEEKSTAGEKTNEFTLVEGEDDWRYKLLLLIPREAFNILNFIPFIVSMTLLYVVYLGLMSTLVQYYQTIEGDNQLIAALKVLPITAGLVSGVFVNKERLIYRISMKWVITASQFANVLLIVWISFNDYHHKNSYWIYCFVPSYLYGFFVNTYFSIYLNAILRNTPGHLQGVVSGLLQTMAQFGICLGNALMATLSGVMTEVTSSEQKEKYYYRFRRCIWVLIGVEMVQVLIMLTLKDQKAVETTCNKSSDAMEEDGSETAQEAEDV